jgi:hypothetical protein
MEVNGSEWKDFHQNALIVHGPKRFSRVLAGAHRIAGIEGDLKEWKSH